MTQLQEPPGHTHPMTGVDNYAPQEIARLVESRGVAKANAGLLNTLALLAGGLCNNAQLTHDGGVQGDPTEAALLVGAHKAGVELAAYARVDEMPFSSDRKMMSVVVQRSGEHQVFAKGATEVILRRCTMMRTRQGVEPLTVAARARLLEVNAQLAGQALRVMALAYKADLNSIKEGRSGSRNRMEEDLVFLGLAGLNDPPREEARQAIAAAQRAGIRVVMITGDHLVTALAVAREVGLEGEGLEGRDLESMDDAALA